jgi:sialic acid synthase SpsE
MNKTFIISEVGVNHNSNCDEAKRLIEIAAQAKVDAVKFQAWSKDRFPEIEHLRLTKNQLAYLQSYAWGHDLEWMCSAFDFESIDFLNEKLRLKRWKIPSGMVTNYPYLEKIKSINPEHVILSTGMCNSGEVKKALSTLNALETTKDVSYYAGNQMDIAIARVPPKINATILHCVTAYPTLVSEVNLGCIESLQFEFDLPVGYSDHSGLVEIPVAAVAMGASVIEVHITMDRDQEGPDHKASYELNELITMVNMICNVEHAMGDGIKRPVPREIEVRDRIREEMKCFGAKTV